MTYRLGDIAPNPFRDIENYPISESKVAELIASYRTTRVWPNVIGRLADGTPQIAYGHHRIEAARRLYGDDFEFPLTIEDLSDDEMFQMMASENMDVYHASAQVDQNTIESLVKAYAEGKVHPAVPTAKEAGGRVRYAPSFAPATDHDPDQDRDRPYTSETLRAYLGWTNLDKVQDALGQLADIERGVMERSDFEGVNLRQAEAMIRSVRHAERASASPTRKHTSGLSQKVREAVVREAKAGADHQRIREVADHLIEKAAPLIEKPAVPKDIAEAIKNDVERFFSIGVKLPAQVIARRQVIRLIAANRDAAELQGLATPWADQIANALDQLAEEAAALAAELRQEAPRLQEVSNAR